MGALQAVLVIPLPEPSTPAPSLAREDRHLHAVPLIERYRVIKHSMTNRGSGFVVIWDFWGVDELEAIPNLPLRLPWFNEAAGAIIEIQRWSVERRGWELCNDPRKG
jgi:hypothetical protein